MKVKVRLSDGSSLIVNLGEVLEVIRNNNKEMFEFMLDGFSGNRSDVQEVLIEDIFIDSNEIRFT